jgi:hypothetical protein
VAFTLLAHNEDGWEDFTTTPSPLTITGVAPGTNCLLVLWCGLIQRGPDSWSTLTVTSSASTTSNNPTWTVPTPISGTGGDSIATSMYAYTEIGSTDPGTFTVSIGFNAFSPADDANWQIAIVKVPAVSVDYRTGSTSASVPWADVNTGADNFSSSQVAVVVQAAGGGGITGTSATTLGAFVSAASGAVGGPPGPPLPPGRMIPPVQAVQRASRW